MATRRARPPSPLDALAEADALLAGRAQPAAARVLELIQVINPTTRALPSKEAARRYALKGRLQSLLIARFGQELFVAVDGDDPAVVSLRHRAHPAVGTHAHTDSLDADARAWVRLQLDTAEHRPSDPPAAAVVASAAAPAPNDPLARGRAALAGPFIMEGRYLWVFRAGQRLPAITVIDLAAWRVTRTPSVSRWFCGVVGLSRASVIGLDNVGAGLVLRLFDARGDVAGEGATATGAHTFFAEAHPSGEGAVAFEGRAPRAPGEVETLWAYVARGRSPGAAVRVAADWDGQRPVAATGRAAGLVFVCGEDARHQPWLVALGVEGDAITVRWRVAGFSCAAFVQEPSGQRVVALVQGVDRVWPIPLGGEAPRLEDIPPGPARRLPRLGPKLLCHAKGGSSSEAATLKDLAAREGVAQMERWLCQVAQTEAPERALAALFAAYDQHAMGLTHRALEVLVGRLPDDPGVRLLRASIAASHKEWEEALDLLDGVSFADAPRAHLAHVWHLRGVAHLQLGDVGSALSDWRIGASLGPTACDLDLALGLVEPLTSAGHTLPAQLRAALHAARAAMDQGDWAGALVAVDVAAVSCAFDLKGLAQSAEAYLAAPTASGAAWFRAAEAIGNFAEVWANRHKSSRLVDLPMPDLGWDEARLAALAARCQAWDFRVRTPVGG